AIEQAAGTDGRRSQRILIDSFGWGAGAGIGKPAVARLTAALVCDPGSGSDHDEVPPTGDRQVFVMDMTAEASHARVARVARTCGAVVMLASPGAILAEIGDAVTRTKEVGAEPIVVYVEDQRSADRARAA